MSTASVGRRFVGGVFRMIVFIAICGGAVWGYKSFVSESSDKPQQAPPKPPVPVTVAAVIQKTIPRQLQEIGVVEAYKTVNVKSQVEGALKSVHFQEGQEVKKGDLLFEIDPEPYQAQVDKAQGEMATKEAEHKAAVDTSAIKQQMFSKNAASKIELITATDQLDTTKAQVAVARAALQQAQINLGWTSIGAPIAGHTGSLMVHQGNIVKANADAPLVVITQVSPIYVSFAVPEQYLREIKGYMGKGTLKVFAAIPGIDEPPEEGTVTFLDNVVDTPTGTIRLKGTFENKKRVLWPGQFVNVTLILVSESNVILAPSQAVQTGQKEQYVFVLKPENADGVRADGVRADGVRTVEYRPVVSHRSYEGNAIIEQGLKPNETVITDGHLNLVDGSKVVIKPSAAS